MWKLSVKLDQDGSLNDDIKAVLIGIIDKYENLVPQGPPLGYKEIEIMPGGPMCTINFLPKYYQILLSSNAKSRFYCQVAYQFAHELCHIYCDPRIFNRFIESICELSSLYFLEYLSNKWGIDPPYPHWKSYARISSGPAPGFPRGKNACREENSQSQGRYGRGGRSARIRRDVHAPALGGIYRSHATGGGRPGGALRSRSA